MILQLGSVLDVPKNFHVLADMSIWQPSDYIQTAQGWTPKRERASYISWQKSVVPNTNAAHNLNDYFGIYILALEIPEPTLYIGIASNDTKSSEGVLNRFKKHRVKISGSHVGTAPTRTGGVNHPINWRKFAKERYSVMGGVPDCLSDVRIVVSRFVKTSIQAKAELERFESSMICNQNNALDKVVDKLWPGKTSNDVRLLNGTRGRPELTTEDQIIF